MHNWSPQQSTALDRVAAWKRSGVDPVFMLAGYAGTGKTTLAKHFAEGMSGVFFAAYTGKAAHVLMRAGAPNVSTIHKLIYLPTDKCKAKLVELEKQRVLAVDDAERVKLDEAIAEEKRNLARPMWKLNTDSPLKHARLLVIDEYSMVDQRMGDDLLSFGCPILALGDPGQLPPVCGEPYFRRAPDVVLTEIHRQAAGNPIIEMSRRVREGEGLAPGTYGESRVLRQSDVTREELGALAMGADQLLVGRNVTRANCNRRAREILGRPGVLPVEGDKLVCLRNSAPAGLLNGQIWTMVEAADADDFLDIHLRNDDGDETVCLAHKNYFEGKPIDVWTRREAEEFDYGYALTVHKAQGSQWDDVVVLDEWRRSNRREWLYTAVTRAAERVTIVQM